MPKRINWAAVVARAREIVDSYDTSVTLRQLFYRLVSEQAIPNTPMTYKRLSDRTAKGRRDGRFPDLIDRGREILEPTSWQSPGQLLADAARQYRVDRTAGQDVSLYLGVEKDGLVTQLNAWFGDLGVPILSPRGFASQTYVKDIQRHVRSADRPAVLLYGGDFDPSGQDIGRDFIERTGCWKDVVTVALTDRQVSDYELPENPGNGKDPRAARFEARNGRLCQVEIDALDPNDLRDLYQRRIDEFWDTDVYDAVRETEHAQRRWLADFAADADGWPTA